MSEAVKVSLGVVTAFAAALFLLGLGADIADGEGIGPESANMYVLMWIVLGIGTIFGLGALAQEKG